MLWQKWDSAQKQSKYHKMKSTKDLFSGELIGVMVEVPLIGTKGKIIEETKNCFEILTKEKHRKKIIKGQKLVFFLDGKKIEVEGKKLQHKPEERLKKIKW